MKKFFSLVLSIFVAGALISCSAVSSDDSSSGLVVQIPSKSARAAVIPEWAEDIDYFTVEVASRDGKSYKEQDLQIQNDSEAKESEVTVANQKASWGATVRFEELPAGWYTVKVLAKTESGKTLGGNENTEPVQVEEGRATSVTITIKKYDSSAGNDEEDEEIELTFGGTVSFNGKEYKTLSEALIAAKTAPAAGANIIANTITFNGNVKETLLNQEDYPSENDCPWFISQDLIIDLKGYTFYWDEFTTENINDYTKSEQNLFVVGEGKTLVIKDGSIVSDSNTVHSASFMRNVSGNSTLVLSDLKIENIVSKAPLIEVSSASLYTSNVTIANCKTKDETNSAIYIHDSSFYALKTNIENVLSAAGSVKIENTQGSFVGGHILLKSSEAVNEEKSVAKRDAALIITNGANSGGQTNFAVASSTIYSNTKVHGVPVIVDGGAVFNLSDGFTFKKFDEKTFTVSEVENPQATKPQYIEADFLGLNKTANVIAAAQSTTVTQNPDSTEVAIYIGSSADSTGQLYISGNSAIYGVARLFLKSIIGQTGRITSEVVTKIDFGESLASYKNIVDGNGNYPLYWAGGSEKLGNEENSFALAKFTIYESKVYDTSYGKGAFVIGDSGRKIDNYGGDNSGNTIYAPVLVQN